MNKQKPLLRPKKYTGCSESHNRVKSRIQYIWNQSNLSNEICITLKGILLQGAIFDSKLRETTASSPPTVNAPALTLAWVDDNGKTAIDKENTVLVPLYTDASRETLVATINMPCNNADDWNIASIALFLR